MRDLSLYRPCVGAVIFNARGQVWLGERYGADGPYNWQFPQGGIDTGESAENALWREMLEEINLAPQDARVLDRTETELIYDYPASVRDQRKNGYHGQRQTWFALRFRGDETRFRFDREDPPEFSDWRWTDFHEAVSRVIPFKRPVYEAVSGRFLPHSL